MFLIVHHLWSRFGPFGFPRQIAWSITFLAVMLAWIPFRATNLRDAATYFALLFDYSSVKLPQFMHGIFGGLPGFRTMEFSNLPIASFTDLIGLFCGLMLVLIAPNAKSLAILSRGRSNYSLAAGALTGLVLIFLLERPNVFIYFVF